MLLWLWPRLEATALTRPLAWEPPYAEGEALKRQKKKKKKKKKGGREEKKITAHLIMVITLPQTPPPHAHTSLRMSGERLFCGMGKCSFLPQGHNWPLSKKE